MLARLRNTNKDDEGFTLIELLVVVIIIGILAAVAIPTFLKQREKGYLSAMRSDVKNAVTAEESFATDNNGTYTLSVTAAGAVTPGELNKQGFNPTKDVTLTVTTPTTTSFKICAAHASVTPSATTGRVMFTSATGQLTSVGTTDCP